MEFSEVVIPSTNPFSIAAGKALMQQSTDDSSFASHQKRDGCWPIVSDLIAVIKHVQISIKASELAIDLHGREETTDNIVLLDDVTPRYVIVNAALNACHASLCEALYFALETKMFDKVDPTPLRERNAGSSDHRAGIRSSSIHFLDTSQEESGCA
jgi:hypothetical protein